MYVAMNSRISIGSLVFNNQVKSASGESSWADLTATATIELPRYSQLLSDARYKIKVGDEVKIELGYDGNYQKEFEGYVSEISPRSVIEIKCEDEMWKFKQSTISKSWKSITLKKLLLELFPGVQLTHIPDVNLSPFRLVKVSPYKALEQLKETYGLVAYFRDKKLFCGLALTETFNETINFSFQNNIPKGQSEQNLIFKTEGDAKIKVKAISTLPSNKKVEVTVGDEEGEEHTLHFYNIKSKDALKSIATSKIGLFRYTGYRGSFDSIGLPLSRHSQIAHLIDSRYPEREGKFFIDRVRFEYGSSGYRRTNTIGKKAA